jgi:hypothetical protein
MRRAGEKGGLRWSPGSLRVNDLGVDVRVLYFDGCPSWQVAAERLQTALDRTGHKDATIELVWVESAIQAAAMGFAGSPTLLVDSRDMFPGAAPFAELTCRLYPTPEGLRGSPTLEALVEALSGRRRGATHDDHRR